MSFHDPWDDDFSRRFNAEKGTHGYQGKFKITDLSYPRLFSEIISAVDDWDFLTAWFCQLCPGRKSSGSSRVFHLDLRLDLPVLHRSMKPETAGPSNVHCRKYRLLLLYSCTNSPKYRTIHPRFVESHRHIKQVPKVPYSCEV